MCLANIGPVFPHYCLLCYNNQILVIPSHALYDTYNKYVLIMTVHFKMRMEQHSVLFCVDKI